MTKLTDAIQASLEAAIETEDAKAETEKKLSAATTAKAASDLALAAEQKKTADLTAENQALAMRVAELEAADASPPADPSPPLISPDGDAAAPRRRRSNSWTRGRRRMT